MEGQRLLGRGMKRRVPARLANYLSGSNGAQFERDDSAGCHLVYTSQYPCEAHNL